MYQLPVPAPSQVPTRTCVGAERRDPYRCKLDFIEKLSASIGHFSSSLLGYDRTCGSHLSATMTAVDCRIMGSIPLQVSLNLVNMSAIPIITHLVHGSLMCNCLNLQLVETSKRVPFPYSHLSSPTHRLRVATGVLYIMTTVHVAVTNSMFTRSAAKPPALSAFPNRCGRVFSQRQHAPHTSAHVLPRTSCTIPPVLDQRL